MDLGSRVHMPWLQSWGYLSYFWPILILCAYAFIPRLLRLHSWALVLPQLKSFSPEGISHLLSFLSGTYIVAWLFSFQKFVSKLLSIFSLGLKYAFCCHWFHSLQDAYHIHIDCILEFATHYHWTQSLGYVPVILDPWSRTGRPQVLS